MGKVLKCINMLGMISIFALNTTTHPPVIRYKKMYWTFSFDSSLISWLAKCANGYWFKDHGEITF